MTDPSQPKACQASSSFFSFDIIYKMWFKSSLIRQEMGFSPPWHGNNAIFPSIISFWPHKGRDFFEMLMWWMSRNTWVVLKFQRAELTKGPFNCARLRTKVDGCTRISQLVTSTQSLALSVRSCHLLANTTKDLNKGQHSSAQLEGNEWGNWL